MDLTAQYEQMLGALLPRGPAWDGYDPLLLGFAPVMSRAHLSADALMLETDPRSVTELIDRYESISNLPDSCTPAGIQTLQQRRQRLDAKINLVGGINEIFYRAQLDALGYEAATITRYPKSSFTSNSTCTDSLYSDEWRYYWRVNIPESAQISPMTCISNCTDSIRTWGETVVECVLNKLAPSHTFLIFLYTE